MTHNVDTQTHKSTCRYVQNCFVTGRPSCGRNGCHRRNLYYAVSDLVSLMKPVGKISTHTKTKEEKFSLSSLYYSKKNTALKLVFNYNQHNYEQ